MTAFRRGVRLGIDVGTARVGVARSDPDGMLAVPVETVPRGEGTVTRIVELAREYEAIEIAVGLPTSLRGGETASTADARAVAVLIAKALPDAGAATPVRLVDERLSTVAAHAQLRASGRSQKGSRKMVDQVAAVVLLQHALDVEKSTGRPPGTSVDPEESS